MQKLMGCYVAAWKIKNAERNVNGGSLSYEISEESKDSLRAAHSIFCIKNMWDDTFTLCWQPILVIWGWNILLVLIWNQHHWGKIWDCFLRVNTQKLWSRESSGKISIWKSNLVMLKSLPHATGFDKNEAVGLKKLWEEAEEWHHVAGAESPRRS